MRARVIGRSARRFSVLAALRAWHDWIVTRLRDAHPRSQPAVRQMAQRRWAQLAWVGLGASVVPLDTAVNIGFPDITRSFGLPIQTIQWVVICYVLTYASLMLAFGRIGDIFGHARVFRTGLAWSVLAFLACAAAPAYGWLLFCRFLQGIGAGLVISVAPALLTGLFPESRRSRAVAAFTTMFALASAFGPLIGGALVSIWGWPTVFWFRAPIALLALVFVKGVLGSARPAVRQPLDLVGAVLLALAISSFLLMINEVQRFGRQDWAAIPLFAVAVAASIALIQREVRFPAPIIKLETFGSLSFVAINSASVLVYLTSFAVLLIVPYYLVRVGGFATPWAGAVLATSFVGTIAASPLAGRLIERVGANYIALAGAALSGIGLIAVPETRSLGGELPLLAALVAQGFGVGLFQVAYMDVVLAALPRSDRGVAGSITMLTRTLGIVSGATVLTLVFHVFETSALAAGQTAPAAFMIAFRWTLAGAGLVSILSGLLAFAFTARSRSNSSRLRG